MARITRRRALQLSTGGLAAILATGRAPAFAQGTTIHWVRGSDYVPVSDQLIRTKLNEQAQKDLGVKINFETVDGLTRVWFALVMGRRMPRHTALRMLSDG